MPKTKKLPCGREVSNEVSSQKSNAELLKSLMARLSEYVASQKLNRSEAREKILDTIVNEARHFTAQSLLERLKRRHPGVGKATLYRNLPTLVGSGLLQEGPADSKGQTSYELADEDHHDHIVCVDCHEIFEYHDEVIEKRQDAVTQAMGFEPVRHRHVIYAKCQKLLGR